MNIVVRLAEPRDAPDWLRLRCALWPEASATELLGEVARFFIDPASSPRATLLAELDAKGIVGMAEVSIRTYAEGCATDRVGYLEGWFVDPGARWKGVGRALVHAAMEWSREQGCTEFGSDTEVENEDSTSAHRALGFAEVGRIRCFRIDL